MNEPETNAVSAAWLTEALIRNRYLTTGEVTAVVQQPVPFLPGGQTLTAHLYSLDVEYAPASRRSSPRHFLLKTSKPDWFDGNRREVEFYEAMRQAEPTDALVRCYAAAFDVTTRSTTLVLEDKGGDQIQTEWPLPHPMPVCEVAVAALAKIHARWWCHPSLNEAPFDHSVSAPLLREVSADPAAFFDTLGDALSAPRRQLIEYFLSAFPAAEARYMSNAPRTLLHGDAHLWNFLVPESLAGPAVLIDWQNWDTGLGAWDLAYMMALHWFPERRLRFESTLLDRYVTTLAEEGITRDRAEIDLDYRTSVLRLLYVPMALHKVGVNAGIWWPHLERVFAAIDDQHAQALLD